MDQKITITYISEDGGGKTAINENNGTTESPTETQTKNSEALSRANQSVFTYSVQRVSSAAKQLIINEARYEIDKYVDLTDNVQAKRDIAIATSLVGQATNVASGIASGAIAGSALGIGGAVAGGLIGLAITGINFLVDVYQRYDQENIQLTKMQYQLEYTRQRSGYSLTATEKGENR